MKRLLFSIGICKIVALCVVAQNEAFYRKVVDKVDCQNCYFLVVSISSKDCHWQIAVESDKLFNYVSKTKGWDVARYRDNLRDVLESNKALDMDGLRSDEQGLFVVGAGVPDRSFRIVKTFQPFETIRNQGCASVLRYYFAPKLKPAVNESSANCGTLIRNNSTDLYMKPRTSLDEQNALISMLFGHGIPVRLDDISGNLKIGYLTIP